MPQVAFTPVIPPQPPEPPARTAASNEPSGTFGDILNASAGPSAPRADAKRARIAGGADQVISTIDGSVPALADAEGKDSGTAQAKTADAPVAAAVNNEQSDPASERCVAADAVTAITTLDLALLAQVIPTNAYTGVSASLPTGKPQETDKAAVKAEVVGPDSTTEGSDDLTASANTPDGTTAAIPAPEIVAVAAAVPTPLLALMDTGSALGVPSVTDQGVTSVSIDSAPAKGPQLTTPTAVNNPSPTAQDDTPSVTAQDDAPFANVKSAPAKTPAQLTAPTSISTPPAAEGIAASAEPGPRIKDAALDSATPEAAPAQPAAASDEPVKAGDAKSAGLPQPIAKPLPQPDQRSENPKTEDDKADGKNSEVKAKNAPHIDAKPAQAQPSGDEAHADGRAGGQDAKAPAAHQAPGQPSDHAAGTARVALAAAHSDISAPTSVAQAVTAQLGNNAPAVGLNVAIPLASPLQSVWQVAPQRGDASDNAVPLAGLAVEIVSRAQDGLRRFEIRLDPPELGRIDVRLDVDRSGNVTSRLTVDRPETLDLLRRDAPQLERALQHAGLSTEGGGLQFSLRDQNFANRERSHQNAPTFILTDDEPAAAEAARRGYSRLIGLGGGIDIRV